jgi:hypothetical protein
LTRPARSTHTGLTPARCSVSMKRWAVRSSKYCPVVVGVGTG